MRRDFAGITNVTGHIPLDARIPYTLPGALAFGAKQRIAALAERRRGLRERS